MSAPSPACEAAYAWFPGITLDLVWVLALVTLLLVIAIFWKMDR